MPKNHAKSIKGLSIACIAISGVTILICLAGLALIAFFGPILEEAIMDSYSYDYGYGYDWEDYYDSIFGAYGLTAAFDPSLTAHHGYSTYYPNAYDEIGELQMALTTGNIALGFMLIAEGVVLAAGIIALKNHNKPEKFGMVFVWSIVGAIIGFLAVGIVQAVLFVIIAVFVNGDKKLYQAGLYFVAPTSGAPGPMAYPGPQPVAPVAPPAPGAPMAQVPAQPAAPISQPAAQPAAQLTQPGEQPSVQMAQPVAQPVPDAMASPVAPMGETQPAAPAEEAQAVEEIAVESVSVPDAAPITPVIVDEGAVIKLDVDGTQPTEK